MREERTAAARAAHRVFLLSPANSGGERMGLILSSRAGFPLARAVQSGGAPLGEVFQFASGLYFRGKLAYSDAFARPPPGIPGSLVIVPGSGLVAPSTVVSARDLRAFAAIPVTAREPGFRLPLERDARALAEHLPDGAEVVLLGSIASDKYVDPLLAILGASLLFPAAFVGRGDMSRGGLMLRAARAGTELEYRPVEGAIRHGPRPPRLPRLRPT
jgi:hypothetical protein